MGNQNRFLLLISHSQRRTDTEEICRSMAFSWGSSNVTNLHAVSVCHNWWKRSHLTTKRAKLETHSSTASWHKIHWLISCPYFHWHWQSPPATGDIRLHLQVTRLQNKDQVRKPWIPAQDDKRTGEESAQQNPNKCLWCIRCSDQQCLHLAPSE